LARGSPRPPQRSEASALWESPKGRLKRYEVSTAIRAEEIDAVAATGCGLIGRSHPAESQERGIENSDQPQSRHTMMSGAGVIGGWLRVRWQLR